MNVSGIRMHYGVSSVDKVMTEVASDSTDASDTHAQPSATGSASIGGHDAMTPLYRQKQMELIAKITAPVAETKVSLSGVKVVDRQSNGKLDSVGTSSSEHSSQTIIGNIE